MCRIHAQTAWKKANKFDSSRLVSLPDVLKVIGLSFDKPEQDPWWETFYHIQTGRLFLAGKKDSTGNWLISYMKKHFHFRVDTDMAPPLHYQFKKLHGGGTSAE
jgi:hypothetical protein